MTVVIQCVMNNGRIQPLQPEKIARFKDRHKQGESFEMILDDGQSSALSPLARKFHALRDEYASVNGYDNEHAKVELKALFGVTAPGDAPPVGRTGCVVEYHGKRVWLLSITDYSPEELERLVMSSQMALHEVTV